MLTKIGIGAATLLATMVFAAPAHADDPGYLGYLRSHGQDIMGYGPVEHDWLTAGHYACARMRDGESPAQAANHPQHAFQENGPLVVEAAQHELCPDKL